MKVAAIRNNPGRGGRATYTFVLVLTLSGLHMLPGVQAKGPTGPAADTAASAADDDTSVSDDTPDELDAIINLDERNLAEPDGNGAGQFQDLRSDAVTEAAYTLALQRAIRHRMEELREQLDEIGDKLDRAFDMEPLLLHDGQVVPPVITTVEATREVQGDNHATETRRVYRIESPARLVNTPPSWRDYLLFDTPVLETVNPAVLPDGATERRAWRAAATDGWDDGIEQANRMFSEAVAEFQRDYIGMIRFARLEAQGVVSAPQLAEGRVDIALDDDVVEIDQRHFRLTDEAGFNESESWDPVISDEDREDNP